MSIYEMMMIQFAQERPALCGWTLRLLQDSRPK